MHIYTHIYTCIYIYVRASIMKKIGKTKITINHDDLDFEFPSISMLNGFNLTQRFLIRGRGCFGLVRVRDGAFAHDHLADDFLEIPYEGFRSAIEGKKI